MYIVDMHCDSLMTVSGEVGLINRYNFSTKYPQLQFVAHFSECGGREPISRRQALLRDINVYLSECERLGLKRIKGVKDILAFEDGDSRYSLFSIEGGAGLFSDSEEFDALTSAGLFVFAPAWDKNELSASSWDEIDTGLTEEGRRIIKKCEELSVITDVSHMSDKAFYETLELTSMPIVATYSNFREVCPSKRNLTLDMAKKIALRGGVIGINLYPEFLREKDASADDIIRHVDYALENLGEDVLGFGFDIDGTDGLYPIGISSERSIHDQVIELLLSRYPEAVVKKIAGENVIRFLKNNISVL